MTATVATSSPIDAMVTTATTTMSVPLSVISCPMKVDSSDARKRRREKLTLHRTSLTSSSSSLDDGIRPHSTTIPNDVESCPSAKKQRTVVVSSDDDDGSVVSEDAHSRNHSNCSEGCGSKSSRAAATKPQMKYDPDIPMSKEEATAWRRDQRRKRNRESAAASRQRQRDRIDELEDELNVWKMRFDEIQSKIDAVAALRNTSSHGGFSRVVPTVTENMSPVSHLSEPVVPSFSPSSAFSNDAKTGEGSSNIIISSPARTEKQQPQPKPIKMISRQA